MLLRSKSSVSSISKDVLGLVASSWWMIPWKTFLFHSPVFSIYYKNLSSREMNIQILINIFFFSSKHRVTSFTKMLKKRIPPYMFRKRPVEAPFLMTGLRSSGPHAKAKSSLQRTERPLCVPINYVKSNFVIGGCKARLKDSYTMLPSGKPCSKLTRR